MGNPTFRSGPITFAAADPVEKFSVVTLGADGVSPAGADDAPFGAVSESAAPQTPNEPGDLRRGLPSVVAVHSSPTSLPLRLAEGDTAEIGDTVYTAAGGAVSTSGGTRVGVVVKTNVGGGDLVRVRLTIPESNEEGAGDDG